MESLVKLQVNNKNVIEKGRINFKKSPKDRLTQSYIETRLEHLNDQWNQFVDTHTRIIETVTKADANNVYFTSEMYESTEDIYINYKSELKHLLKIDVPTVSDQQTKVSANVRLPKICLPKFSGLYSEWISFRDLFLSLIHNNAELDGVQKLHYLKTHLSGEAEQLLRYTPVTTANYETCWSILLKRYDNKRFLSSGMLKRLLNQPAIVKESSTSIKNLLDTTVECLHGLRTMGIDVSTWDTIVIYIICEKLDNESRKMWESRISEDDALPTFTIFQGFLESRFRSLEFLDTKYFKNTGSKCNFNVKSFHVSSQLCVFCSGDHKLSYCKKFASQDSEARRTFARTSKLCYNCLDKGHIVYFCRQSTKCRLCKKRHHSLLHPEMTTKAAEPVPVLAEENVAATVAISSTDGESSEKVCCLVDVHSQGLLATALVCVESKAGTKVVLRALLDQGSQVSFITESAVQLLGLTKTSTTTDIFRLGDNEGQSIPSKWTVTLKLQSRLDPEFVLHVDAFVLSRLTSSLPERKIIQDFTAPPQSELADPGFGTPGRIDLLLSTRVVGEVLVDGLIKGSPGTPIAQKTKLGWILSGEICSASVRKPVCFNAVVHADTNNLLRMFWELEESESTHNQPILTEEERKCEELYTNSTKRDVTGRYIVRLPFNTDHPSCVHGGSEDIARKRFYMLERRLASDPEFKMQYSAVINEYVQMGHAEVVPEAELSNNSFYLPHHAVLRSDKTTTKVRVVFDASCSGYNGVSLNDNLMVGPTLQLDLRQIIMRWRRHPICLVADIVKMYRQIRVADQDVDYQRLLWRSSPSDDLQHLRLLRVTFGVSSAPYLAVRTLQQLARDDGGEFSLVADQILKDYYVDDYLSGCETVSEGEQIYHQMNTLLNRGGFELQKWSSNSDDLLRKINDSLSSTNEALELKIDGVMKILGLIWDRERDMFRYTVTLPEITIPVTKRGVVSDIARLFDPLGWLAPVIITAKVFIQRLWLSGVGWDEELPDNILNDWLDYRKSLYDLKKFELPRWIQTRKTDVCIELQGFCDASNTAYAAVVYIRTIDSNDNVRVSLVASKTRVAPVKQVSIPRLELCGALLLSKILCEVSATLGVSRTHVHAWTDSSVVLSWLSSHPSRWKTFVGNRVSEIHTVMDRSQWSHVQSKENPADFASRGVSPKECVGLKLWKEGPGWLWSKDIDYNMGSINKTNLEERVSSTVCSAIAKEDEKESILSRYSSLNKLIRVIAYCRRFLKIKQLNVEHVVRHSLTSEELKRALTTCIKMCQAIYFGDELDMLRKSGKVSKGSKLTTLNPYLDQDQVLRVAGRLQMASIFDEMKHPYILPHKSNFTNLLIADAHERTLHGGPQLVLNHLRSKFWIVNAKSVVRQHIRKCIVCIRHSPRVVPPLMGQLPSARVNAGRPFLRSGVDYAGPISIRPTKGRGYRSTKGYICLFVCMATRAIHLEVVSDMTSQAFLAALKRFTARRGHCSELWSDNGTTFVGANRELKALLSQERSLVASDVADWLATNGTKWNFIPPYAPNFGGLWEAGVKSTKHHLRRVIGNSTLTYEEMATVLSQIEACLNSRPITTISNYPEDPHPLTPGHFLIGGPLLLLPDSNFSESNISTLKRWHLTQRMLQEFWRRWSREYLVQFHHRYKWSHQTVEPKVGDVVLVMEDDLPPARWLYGVIVEKHTGLDMITRVVTLRCKDSRIKRPVSKLIVLPISN